LLFQSEPPRSPPVGAFAVGASPDMPSGAIVWFDGPRAAPSFNHALYDCDWKASGIADAGLRAGVGGASPPSCRPGPSRRPKPLHRQGAVGLLEPAAARARLAFRNRKYFRTNCPSRATSGPLQILHAVLRSTASGPVFALTTWYRALQFGQRKNGGG
jgi:hypothetical protein